jgi:hypothetical protein
MAFKFSLHLTTVTKEAFQTVVFPTEEKTTEKFQSVCQLNNTPLSKVISYKNKLQHHLQIGFRAAPIVVFHKEILFYYMFVFNFPCTSYEIPTAYEYLRTNLTYSNPSECRKVF